MTGLLGVSQSFVDDLNERLRQKKLSTKPTSVPVQEMQTTEQDMQPRQLGEVKDFGYFGVSYPVQCLPLGATVAWHLRPNPNPIYPVYLRSNLLNTNLQFDYGAFR